MELIKNLMNAIHYVDSHLTQDISVEDVAAKHICRFHIFSVFFMS